MSIAPLGIHHVTAVASDPQRNVDFYYVTLGLRLVKKTVNFDAPDTYHLYYGDLAGHPGTLITFFPWPGTPRGRRGTGQATVTSFSVREASLGWWKQHLERVGVEVAETTTRFEEDALAFHDPDGLVIELVAHAEAAADAPWPAGPVPEEHQLRGLYGVTLTEAGYEATW
jgi:glyoxalase family protein